MLNGVTELIMMKSDVLSGFDEVKILANEGFVSMPGWKEDITNINHIDQIPDELMNYMSLIEEYVEVPIYTLSVGPGRNQIVNLNI